MSHFIGPLLGLMIAYLCGSIPMALLLGKSKGIDIRLHGSGNVGATNVFRVLGKGWGVGCLLFDIFKGWAPAMALSGAQWARAFWRPEAVDRPTWTLIIGLAAVAGHSFSPWIGWKGGKGVATSIGMLLAVAPAAAALNFVLGIAIIGATGYVSLASITGAVALPILIIAIPPGGERPWPAIAMTAVLGVFVIWRHRSNIGRLRHGNENRIFGKKRSGGADDSARDPEIKEGPS